MAWLAADLRPLPDVANLIDAAIADEPALQPGDGGVIREGFSSEMDRIRAMANDARGYIAGLEAKERERTGIRNLKVGFNQVFGYYIEVSRSNLESVPDDYQRRQTLTNGERYITPELKEYESQALDARERLEQLERALYRQVCQQIADHAEAISRLAAAVARVDVCAGLANIAARHSYVRPALDDGNAIKIVGGRHPVVERVLDDGVFVPNDAALDADDAQIMLITGPNMAGKSTYIRQVALIVLMAQVGSFVPATSASIGLVDRIFTRVGLQDDLGYRAVDVHGRDGGDRSDTQSGHVAVAGDPGRDRPGNQHLRRTVHRSGSGRAPAQQSQGQLQDAVRHALPRIDRAGCDSARCAQLPGGGVRGGWAHRVPASHRAGRRGPIIRGARRHAGRDADVRG